MTQPPDHRSTPTLSESRFLLFGGTGGIGQVVARSLHAAGARVVLVGRTEQPLRSLAQELDAEYHCADVTQSEQVDAVVEAALQRGPINGLAHLVGSIVLKPAHLTSDEEWARTITLNLTSAFYCLRAGLKALSSNGGSIVLMSSTAAKVGLPNHEAIAAAKAGIEGLVRSSAASYATKNIRVNAVAPGLVRTPLSSKLLAHPAAEKASIAMHPLRRLGEPEDIARVVEMLLNPSNSWITGQTIFVDGGLADLRVRSDS